MLGRRCRRCGQRRAQIDKGGVVLVGRPGGRGFVRILTLGLPVSSLPTVSALRDLLEFLRADALLPHYLLAMRGPVLEVSTVLADDLLDSLILRPRLLLSLAVVVVPSIASRTSWASCSVKSRSLISFRVSR